MIPATDERHGGAMSWASRPPLDVRILARFYYVAGGLCVLYGILLCGGVIEPSESYRVLFGGVVITDGLTQGVLWLFSGFCYLIYDWGLRRGVRFVWWFMMASSVWYLITEAVMLPSYPVRGMIHVAFAVSFIAWLWFRKELYGIHPTKSR